MGNNDIGGRTAALGLDQEGKLGGVAIAGLDLNPRLGGERIEQRLYEVFAATGVDGDRLGRATVGSGLVVVAARGGEEDECEEDAKQALGVGHEEVRYCC